MEYHRNDENMLKKTNVESLEDEPEGKGCQRCWIPNLKTLGDIDDNTNINDAHFEQIFMH